MKNELEQWHTYAEIMSQPKIWNEWSEHLVEKSADIKAWVKELDIKEVWFSGAGTSAFIGDSLSAHLNADNDIMFKAVSTTDFVAAPYNYLVPKHNLLIVSFGRSGESSETVAMMDILDEHYSNVDRLNITCNQDSHLANVKLVGDGQQKSIILPAETLDQGFAMTSSYTTMFLSGLACFDKNPPEDIATILKSLSLASKDILANLPTKLGDLYNQPPKRCIFLGSGALLGTARESSLKILELTAGKTVTQWDSGLGFRHGPKAIVDDETRIFVFISNHPHTQKYDVDIANEITAQYGADRVIKIGVNAPNLDITLGQDQLQNSIAKSDVWCSNLYVLVAQMLSMNWSQKLGLNVDNPFIGQGNLTRVVAGVTIYPYGG